MEINFDYCSDLFKQNSNKLSFKLCFFSLIFFPRRPFFSVAASKIMIKRKQKENVFNKHILNVEITGAICDQLLACLLF